MTHLRALASWITTGAVTIALAMALVVSNQSPTPTVKSVTATRTTAVTQVVPTTTSVNHVA